MVPKPQAGRKIREGVPGDVKAIRERIKEFLDSDSDGGKSGIADSESTFSTTTTESLSMSVKPTRR